MKKLFIITFTALILFPFCSKDDTPDIEENIISATISGESFSTSLAQSDINTIVIQFFSIAGATDEGNDKFKKLVILFELPIGEIIEKNTYSFNDSNCSGTTNVCGRIDYGLTGQDDGVTHSSKAENGSASITLSSIDYKKGGYAIGTFSGTLVDDTGDVVDVTDGKFNVKIQE